MDYTRRPQHHYKPQSGWMNDPNGLVYFDGYYHMFYQHAPHHEIPWQEPFIWGHARTKDFLTWEELPLALVGDHPYDEAGCWSGTALVKDDTLYLFYASINTLDDDKMLQTVSVAYSKDGIHFEKYEGNPVIPHYPPEGCHDFRDPAVACIDGKYYLVIATGNRELNVGRLLLYTSEDLFHWELSDILCEWEHAKCAECPSFMQMGEKCLLTTSVLYEDGNHFFSLMLGDFKDGHFTPTITGNFDKGPDQYAGQVFTDPKGRHILVTWIPGWKFARFAPKDVGCLSLPREITVKDGKFYGYPIEEVRHLLRDSDPAVKMTDDGFIIERELRDPIVHKGAVSDLKILRDEYILEVFVNGGETVYSALLC